MRMRIKRDEKSDGFLVIVKPEGSASEYVWRVTREQLWEFWESALEAGLTPFDEELLEPRKAE